MRARREEREGWGGEGEPRGVGGKGEGEERVARTMRRMPGVPGSLIVVLYLAPIVMDPIAANRRRRGGSRGLARRRRSKAEGALGGKGLRQQALQVESRLQASVVSARWAGP